MRLQILDIEKRKDNYLARVKYLDNDLEFYPDGKGGQLGDRGKIEEVNVLEVDKDGNLVLDTKLKIGEYDYIIDMKRRDEIAKNHTTQHIISAYLKKKYGYDTVGFRMGEEYTTVDFPDLSLIDKHKIKDLEVEVNEIIRKNMTVEIKELTREEAEKITSLRKSINDKIIGNIKVVKIEDLDINACGGFHVTETKDIGLFKVINYEKVKKTITRIYYKAGKLAYEDYYEKHEILKKATSQLSSTIEKINDKIDQLLEENKVKNREFNNLYSKYSEFICKQLKEDALNLKENKVIIYKQNDAVSKFFSKYIDSDEYSLIYGEDGNFTVISSVIDCIEIKKTLEKLGYSVKGGGNSHRVNIKTPIDIEIIVEIFKELL